MVPNGLAHDSSFELFETAAPKDLRNKALLPQSPNFLQIPSLVYGGVHNTAWIDEFLDFGWLMDWEGYDRDAIGAKPLGVYRGPDDFTPLPIAEWVVLDVHTVFRRSRVHRAAVVLRNADNDPLTSI